MDNVTEFPTRAARSRAKTERDLRSTLRSTGVSQKVEDTVLSNMTEFIEILVNFDLSVQVPGADPAGAMKLQAEISDTFGKFTDKLLGERMRSESRHCASRGLA